MNKYGYYKYITKSNLDRREAIVCGYNFRHTIKKFIDYNGDEVYQVIYHDHTIKNYKSISAAKAVITKYDRL